MAVDLLGVTIGTVAVIDDDPNVREGYEFNVHDADLESHLEAGPLEPDPRKVVERTRSRAQAALCDHHLGIRTYASFYGAELVAAYYEAGVPAVLCTRWETAHLDWIRPYRDRIPVLIRPDELNPDSLIAGFEACLMEMQQGPGPERVTYRAHVHVVDVDPQQLTAFVLVPAWIEDTPVRLLIERLPPTIAKLIKAERDVRLHAAVNLGAERSEDLFFGDWESS
jgi:hypothetical protein